MSGLEVAGIVLGALPLIITALEHYAKGVSTAKRFWSYKSEVRFLLLQINTESGIFVNTIEQLLTGIVRNDQMAKLMASVGAEEWQDKVVEQRLKDRLRGAYQVYLDNVQGMAGALQKMMEKLALGPDGKPPFADPNLFKQEFKRLKFGLSKSEYTEQLTALRTYNQSLTSLTKQSLELEPSRGKLKSKQCPNFRVLQDYARSLYETLKSGLRCGCSGHAVKLRLESRTQRLQEGDDLLEHAPFRVIFTDESASASPQPKSCNYWKWTEADIRYIADQPVKVLLSNHANIAATTSKPLKLVRFTQIETQSSSSSITLVENSSSSDISRPPEHIADLCTAVKVLGDNKHELCIGYLIDDVKRKHGIYPLEAPSGCDQQQWVAYSLRQVLSSHTNIGRPLRQHDKLRIAVDLASSVLQLYRTPWLDEHWSDNDVFFIHRPGVPLSTLYEHPFVYRRLSSPCTIQPLDTQRAVGRVIRNPTLFTLGILLIELLYGKLIEELQTPQDQDCDGTPGVAWCTADRLIEEEIEFEAGPRYLEAVRRCVRCDFNRKESSLDDEAFQQAVFEGVVTPLEKTLQQFLGRD